MQVYCLRHYKENSSSSLLFLQKIAMAILSLHLLILDVLTSQTFNKRPLMRPEYHIKTGLQNNEGIIWETEIVKVNTKGGKWR